MGVLPVATEKFPAGTIFLCTGSAPLVDNNGQVVKDPTRMRSKLLAFNDAGEVLGEIDTGQGSVFEQINGSPIILINALGFDADGNVYVNTVGAFAGLADPANGGIYALTKEDIANNKLPPPVDGDLGALDGLDFTAGGVMLNAQIRGDVPGKVTVSCRGKIATTLALQPGGTASDLNGPADLAVRRSADGTQLVVIPELYARDTTAGDDEVTVLALPAGFDAACARDLTSLN